MQLVVFSSDRSIICRIGHYDSEGYAKIKRIVKEKKLHHTNENLSFDKDIKIKQRKWCDFRIDKNFAKSRVKGMSEILNYLYENRFRIKSYSFPSRQLERLRKAVKKTGWHALSSTSDRYSRHLDRREFKIRDRYASLVPQNKDEACVAGYTGNQCKKCCSWKVREHSWSSDVLFCSNCHNIWKD